MARLVFATTLLSLLASLGLSAQAASPLPTRKPVAQVNLKSNEPYYLETFKADIDRLETSLSSLAGQPYKLSSKEKLDILMNTIDTILFRQYCDREGIKVSDADVASQMAQYKSSLGAGATDATVEASLRRNGVFTDVKSYFKQDMLFTAYLRAKKADEVKALGNPSAADVLKAYDDMKFNLRRPLSFRITMITAGTQAKSESEKKKIGDSMRALANQLKVNPDGFDEALVKGAVDPKAAGYQTIPNAVFSKTAESKKSYPELYDAVFKLKEGEISDLVASDAGYTIVRVGALLPEKQLGLDDYIEGLTSTKAASSNPFVTVLQLVASEMQTTKIDALQKSARDAINAKLHKEGVITLSLANLAGVLDDAEIAALKALKGNGYNTVLQ
jgi:parvulin-like peptidyl-prolyl isomerase